MATNKLPFTLRIDERLYQIIKDIADMENRSMNAQILMFLEKCVDEYRPPKKRRKP